MVHVVEAGLCADVDGSQKYGPLLVPLSVRFFNITVSITKRGPVILKMTPILVPSPHYFEQFLSSEFDLIPA